MIDLICKKFKKGVLTFLTIKELKLRHEIIEAFPIMKQLRTHLDEGTYLELVMAAQEVDRYKMRAQFCSNNCASLYEKGHFIE